MALRIEDYALIGDCRTAALVGRDGSIDWLCVPRFDQGACFAALLGTAENGRWKIGPREGVNVRAVRRRYRPGTLVLETEFETETGVARLTDAMAMTSPTPTIVRTVEGLRGEVPIRAELVIRFDYGWIVPWVRKIDRGVTAIAGPDMLQLRSGVEHRGEGLTTVAEFVVKEGQSVPFSLAWHPSSQEPPPALDAASAVSDAERWWLDWSSRCTYQGPDRDIVLRSLITLKAMTYSPTGGTIAAVTTSLPEQIGGVRNWDYRYCWLRDATFALFALLDSGYVSEAREWRDWLLRAVAGKPDHLQIMYGVGGERRLTEMELDWLPGYEGSKPVRVGNAASMQFQLDVFGELANVLHHAHAAGIAGQEDAWRLSEKILEFVEDAWKKPDEGIWEVRGERRHFTHSKVMAWVAFDRAVKAVETFGLTSDHIDRWRNLRSTIHEDVCRNGFNSSLNSFVQSYGSKELDASLLMIPLVDFLPPDDPRVKGTVAAVQSELNKEGFVCRYNSSSQVDGLPPGEGVFLPCTFWLADNLVLQGRRDEARTLFDRLVGLCNDVGLLAEEYDPKRGRQLGNYPQAFSHVCLVNTAHYLARREGKGLA